jgi:DNA-binding MarR family transcriptional regulator
MANDVREVAAAIEQLVRVSRSFDVSQTVSRTGGSLLRRLVDDGPARITALAEAEHVSQPAMTAAIKRLAAQGYVTRQADPDDARAVRVAITDQGAKVVAMWREQLARRVADVVENQDPQHRRQLAEALPALNRLTGLLRESLQEISRETP